MSNVAAIFLAATFLAAPAGGEERDPTEGPRAVAEAEKNFATASRDKGMGTAALEAFADDAVSFDPGPTNSRKFWTAHLNDVEVLVWQPAFVACSHAGDLGFTTGPWQLQKSHDENAPLAFGDYVTIWKQQADGAWRVALDIGVTHGKPAQPVAEVELAPFDPGSADHDPELTKRALFKAQRAFLENAKKNGGAAVVAAADDEIRVLRPASFPAVGVVAARLMLAADRGKLTRKFSGSAMSRSGDLAYTYGDFTAEWPDKTDRGYYLTIWKLDLNGDWHIALDLEKRAPPAKP